MPVALFNMKIAEMRNRMLSRDCDGCPNLKECSKRFQKAKKGDKVYCPDGTVHLIDNSSVDQNNDAICMLETFQ